MDKRSKIALYSIGAIILLMMIAEITKPKALNWRDSYSAADKIPLGCYVLYNELQSQKLNKFSASSKSAYETLKQNRDKQSQSTLLFINNYISIDEQGSNEIIKYVEEGNSVFISTNYFEGIIADTLNLIIDRDYNNFFKDPAFNSFTSPSLKNNETLFKDVIENSFITSVDTLSTTVLGNMSSQDKSISNTNYIKVPFGNKGGNFYIHTNPFAFTNYHMLNQKENYVATVLSFLPNNNWIWDNYYKSGRKIITSPLRFILSNKALKWAFYLILFALALFVLFRGKRTQRIIPVIEPLKNSSVEFTKTIGDLYFQHGDFSNIINKKTRYFLEFIRTHYYLNTNNLNQRFINKLAIKSSNTVKDTKELVDYITYLKSKSTHTEKELITLNKKIEHFTKHNL